MRTYPPTPSIAFPFVGDTVGGSHVSTLLLMRELPRLGFGAIALVHNDGPLIRYLRSKSIDFIQTRLPYFSAQKSGLAALACAGSITPRLSSFVKRNHIALIHVNDGRMIATWAFASRLAACPIVVHARHRWAPSRLAYICFQLAHARIAISSYVHDSMPKKLAKKTIVLSNPFETTVIDRDRARKGIAEAIGHTRSPVIAFLGTLTEQKRPSIFLRAAACLSQVIRAQFLVFGRDGNVLCDLKKQTADLGIADFVTFTGFRQDVESLLAGCDLVIAPAVNEGHGRVLVEAMLHRVPVIASDSGGHSEIIRHRETGLLVTPDDPEAFAKAALQILNDRPFRDAIVDMAWSWANLTFSPTHHAEQVAGLYRKLLKIN